MPLPLVPDPGPFLEHVGPVLADGDVIALRIAPQHLNRSGAAQGGLLATLVDFALGRAIHATAESRAVTVSLTTDYLGAAKEGDLVEARLDALAGPVGDGLEDDPAVSGDHRDELDAGHVDAGLSGEGGDPGCTQALKAGSGTA